MSDFIAPALDFGLGLLGMGSANNAGDAQAQAAAQASANEMAMFNQNREDMAPWRDAGKNALAVMTENAIGPNASLTRRFNANDFKSDPGYNFLKNEGNNALTSSLASMGMANSGRAVKEGMRFNNGLAAQSYGDAYNRFSADQAKKLNALSSISGVGQTTANQVATMGTNAANQVSANTIGAGNARAGAIVGGNNALMNGIGNAAYGIGRIFK